MLLLSVFAAYNYPLKAKQTAGRGFQKVSEIWSFQLDLALALFPTRSKVGKVKLRVCTLKSGNGSNQTLSQIQMFKSLRYYANSKDLELVKPLTAGQLG
jgi:hypothetical protein